jgi:oligopeptidase A
MTTFPDSNLLPDNPLWQFSGIPEFSKIKEEHVVPAIRKLLEISRKKLEDLEKAPEISYDGLIGRLNEIDRPFKFVWEPVLHLLGVRNTPELREAHQEILGEVVDFSLRQEQSRPIFEALESLKKSDAWESLTPARKRIVENKLRDARLAGVGLEESKRVRFNEIHSEISRLSTDFSNHVLDAIKAFSLIVTDVADTEGWPASLKGMTAQNYNQNRAESAPEGNAENGPWRVTIDMAVLGQFLKFSRNREQRKQIFLASITKASSGELDNGPIIDRILELRREMASLLGFGSYAEMQIAVKMAGKVERVDSMFAAMEGPARGHAEADLAELKALAREEGVSEELDHWDHLFWSERLREKRFSFTAETLRQYFPLPKVLDGLFQLANRLFGVNFTRANGEAPIWNEDVQYFKVSDETGEQIASFYLDPYSRPKDKRGGAWMNDLFNRDRINGKRQLPVIYLVCNMTPPVGGKPPLITFQEITTLFHEFGHGLQAMLTRIEDLPASGINGVEWDAVELASQFMENWCYQKPTLLGMSSHVETGEKLPEDLFEKVKASKNFRVASGIMKMIEYGALDIELHHRYDPKIHGTPIDVQRRIAEKYSVVPMHPESRFLCSFRHIFAGGYSAGYYSYQWAEILSADAFSAFEEVGLDDEEAVRKMGKKYRETILALGGSRPALEIFTAFRGREPLPEALLRHSGLL